MASDRNPHAHSNPKVLSNLRLAFAWVIVAGTCALLPQFAQAREPAVACARWFGGSVAAEAAAPRATYTPPVWTPTIPRRQSGVVQRRSMVDAMMRLNPALATARTHAVISRRIEQRTTSREIYGSNWEHRSLGAAIEELLSTDPRAVRFYATASKIFYEAEGRAHYIVEDPAGGYFRVYDAATNIPTSPWSHRTGRELSDADTHFRSDEPVPTSLVDDETLSICRSLLGPPDAGGTSLNRVRISALQRCFPFLESREPIMRAIEIARASREVSWIEPLMAWLENKRDRLNFRRIESYERLAGEVAIAIDEIQIQHMTPYWLPLHALVNPRASERAEALASLVGVELRARDEALLILIAANATSVAAIRQYLRIAVARPNADWERLIARWRFESNSPWGRPVPSVAYEVAHGAAAMAAAIERRRQASSPASAEQARDLAGAYAD